jgi:hypothetical protein
MMFLSPTQMEMDQQRSGQPQELLGADGADVNWLSTQKTQQRRFQAHVAEWRAGAVGGDGPQNEKTPP